MRRALDLFSGTQSVAYELALQGFEVTTLDVNPKLGANWQCDIMAWEYRDVFRPGHFELIFAAPPCEHFSQARTTSPRDLTTADAIVQRRWR